MSASTSDLGTNGHATHRYLSRKVYPTRAWRPDNVRFLANLVPVLSTSTDSLLRVGYARERSSSLGAPILLDRFSKKSALVVRGIIDQFSAPSDNNRHGKTHGLAMRFGPIKKLRHAVDLVVITRVRE